MASFCRVGIYIFSADDSGSVRQRMRYAVDSFCGICGLPRPSEEALVIARTEKGKPYFPTLPQMHFSISHSGKYWSCAVADQNIGYDLQEREIPQKETPDEMLARHQKMAARFFHPTEAEFVSMDCRSNFLTVWTAREAYVKHTGQGIDRYYSEHCVIPGSLEEMRRISGNTSDISWSAMGKYFRKTYYDGAYTLCVCTETPCETFLIPVPDAY